MQIIQEILKNKKIVEFNNILVVSSYAQEKIQSLKHTASQLQEMFNLDDTRPIDELISGTDTYRYVVLEKQRIYICSDQLKALKHDWEEYLYNTKTTQRVAPSEAKQATPKGFEKPLYC